MSLAIVVTTNEGNIIAVDSLETYKNAIGDIREGSKYRQKLFKINKNIALAYCGISFIDNKTINQHIEILKKNNNFEETSIQEITNILYDYFYETYQSYLTKTAEKHKKQLESLGNKDVKYILVLECIKFTYKNPKGETQSKEYCLPVLEFLLAGYNKESNNVYKITIPDRKDKGGITIKIKDNQAGATWIGQTDVLVRIIRGWSPALKSSEIIRTLPDKKKELLLQEFNDQEYIINWATMTLQDAIEFVNLAIKITEQIQSITDGTWQNPGSSPGVGGEIDIALTTKKQGFIWLKKKKLKIDNIELDLN